jgi:glutamate/tyrosine decarboxylase-like PLP-dependent enzyme
MPFDPRELSILEDAMRHLRTGFERLPAIPNAPVDAHVREALLAAADRLRDNYPYHHPFYIGQMMKPPHPVARLAYALAMHVNPNNHALDGGRASSAMEKEAVAEIARMFGWEEHLGHLCSGGTMANFEALWIGRELAPGKAVAASSQAHYTHGRLSAVLAIPFVEIDAGADGRMNLDSLARALGSGMIGAVVATLGTTAAGRVDPLPEILALCRQHGVRVHVDAAYGGYFVLAENLEPVARAAFDCIGEADSLVIDPHKHGLQPYGCGCVLFKDPSVGRFYKHDSPYTYFTSGDVHMGEITLECSRAGASAVALWTTMRMLPPVRGGEFARSLESCREGAMALFDMLHADERCAPLFPPALDIVVWAMRANTCAEASARAQAVFRSAAARDVHLALATFPRAMVEPSGAVMTWDAAQVTCLRACVMKPEHREWLHEIFARLRAAMDGV